MRDLVANQPGQESAAAKDVGFVELAIGLRIGVLQTREPSYALHATMWGDVRSLELAARMPALLGMAIGLCYEITGTDALGLYVVVMAMAEETGKDEMPDFGITVPS